MDTNTIRRELDEVERYLRKAKRASDSGNEIHRYINRALSALEDAQRLVR